MRLLPQRASFFIRALATFATIALFPITIFAGDQVTGPETSAKYEDHQFSAILSSATVYRTVDQVVSFMDTLRTLYPHVVSEKWSLGQSHEGRDIWCFRMSDNPDIDQGRPAALFDGLHHCGEWPSMLLVTDLAEYFAQSYGIDPEITYLLDHREVYFVPIVNPDGRVYIEETGESWPKKNRRDNGDGTFGVNLNDNYPFMWGVSGVPENDSTWSHGYRGPYAGSEPETQAIMALVNSHDFVTHQSFHTPGTITFYPWGYTADPTPDESVYSHMGEMMTRLNGYEPVPIHNYGVFSGSAVDWSYGAQDEHNKIFAFTNEVASSGLGTLEEQLREIRDDNIWPAEYLIRVAGPYVLAGDPAVAGGDGNGDLDPGETAGLSFTLTNQGVRRDAADPLVRLSCDDPYVQLHEAERAVGTIPAFSSTDFSLDPFSATVDPACPIGRAIRLKVTVMQQDGPLEHVLAYVVGGPVVFLDDDFESGTGAWNLTGAWGLTSSMSNSPTHSLTDSPAGNYSDLDSTSATTAQPILANSLYLSFWELYEVEKGFDFVQVQISSGGGPWTTLLRRSGSSNGWKHVEITLDDYLDEPIQIRFLLEADWSETDDGWYIDDVRLVGIGRANQTPPPPAMISPMPGVEVVNDPVLSVSNTTDPDGVGPLTYGFRVYADSLCTDLVASVDDLKEGNGRTDWHVVPVLADGVYWWRAYAADSVERGLLGETRMFEKVTRLALLAQNYPNPFSSTTTIRYWIKEPGRVRLCIYDPAGRLVRTLVDQVQSPSPEGYFSDWDGKSDSNKLLSSGVYFCRLTTKHFSETRRIVFLQ